MMMSFIGFSQNDTVTTSIQLEKPIVKLVIKDLITGDDELREYVYKIICDKVILQYKEKLGIDDVEFTDEVLGD